MTSNYLKALQDKPATKFLGRSKGLAPLNLSKTNNNMLLIDTETIGDITKGEPAFPYDISFLNLQKRKITHEVAYINKDIFDNDYLMENAFYKSKIPFYRIKLATDKRYNKLNGVDVLVELNNFIKKYNIKYYLAYNVSFDCNSINNLYDKLDVKNYFKKLRLIDIQKICYDIIGMFPELYRAYMVFCGNNGYITESGKNVSTSAETMNKFVNNDKLFVESHTGLEDTFCEYNILIKMLWYYEKETHSSYYYKLDSTYPKIGYIFKNGIFNVENIPNYIK